MEYIVYLLQKWYNEEVERIPQIWRGENEKKSIIITNDSSFDFICKL